MRTFVASFEFSASFFQQCRQKKKLALNGTLQFGIPLGFVVTRCRIQLRPKSAVFGTVLFPLPARGARHRSLRTKERNGWNWDQPHWWARHVGGNAAWDKKQLIINIRFHVKLSVSAVCVCLDPPHSSGPLSLFPFCCVSLLCVCFERHY